MKQTVEERIFEATRVRLASRIRYRNLQHGAAQRVQNQDAPQPDLFLKSVRRFRNMVRNLDADVLDKRFFRIISENLPHDKGVALIQMAFTYEEIFNMYSNWIIPGFGNGYRTLARPRAVFIDFAVAGDSDHMPSAFSSSSSEGR